MPKEMTVSEMTAMKTLYKGVSDADLKQMRERSIKARGSSIGEGTLSSTSTVLGTEMRNGDVPRGSIKAVYDPSVNRSSANLNSGVATFNSARAKREEITHVLNPQYDVDTSDNQAEDARRQFINMADPKGGDNAYYYVYGSQAERRMAMSMLKQAVGMSEAGAGGDPVKATSGRNIVSELGQLDLQIPGAGIATRGKRNRSTFTLYGTTPTTKDGKRNEFTPANTLLNEAKTLFDKSQNGIPMNHAEKEAWEDIRNPNVWDKLAKTDTSSSTKTDTSSSTLHTGEQAYADMKGGEVTQPAAEEPEVLDQQDEIETTEVPHEMPVEQPSAGETEVSNNTRQPDLLPGTQFLSGLTEMTKLPPFTANAAEANALVMKTDSQCAIPGPMTGSRLLMDKNGKQWVIDDLVMSSSQWMQVAQQIADGTCSDSLMKVADKSMAVYRDFLAGTGSVIPGPLLQEALDTGTIVPKWTPDSFID